VPAGAAIPALSSADTLRVVATVLGPTLAQGAIARRPRVVGLAERLQVERSAVATMRSLTRRYGPGPVRVRIPGRSLALVLDPDDVHRVLRESPEPFALASREKRGALDQFQPGGVLVSHGVARRERRAVNEAVLDSDRPVHRHGEAIVRAVREEAAAVAEAARARGALTWDQMSTGWRRAVRRVILGDDARDDHQVHAVLDRLRYRSNWSVLLPRDHRNHQRLRDRLQHHLRQAGPGSLAHDLAEIPTDEDVDRLEQIPQWLFAADPAGMAAFRALALLTADPDELSRARSELGDGDPARPRELRRLRAAVLESVRLWATTPLILRETTRETEWSTGTMPAGTGVAVFAPFFHRDPDALAIADSFAPDEWRKDGAEHRWPLVPFSEGPGVCPGQNLVLLMTSTFMAGLLERLDLDRPAPWQPSAVPPSLNPFTLVFRTDTDRSEQPR
jgi:cytochrome P450